MFRSLIAFVMLLAVAAFAPAARSSQKHMHVYMKNEMPALNKIIGSAVIASALFGGAVVPAFAKEGAEAKIGIFNNAPLSSPFVDEDREDPIYSPYSPYGDGSKAAYNTLRDSDKEYKFWKGKFDVATSKIAAVPKFVSKKSWMDINSALTLYAYDLRDAGNRLAAASSSPAAAQSAVNEYYKDLEDIMVNSKLKQADKVLAAFEKSNKDLSAFKAIAK